MKIWKIAIWLLVLPMLAMVSHAWTFSFDFWANSTGNTTIPNQPFSQSFAINSVDTNLYYYANNTVAMGKSDINDVADVQPLVYYNNASNRDLTFFLNSTGSEGLNTVCEVYVKPSSGTPAKLTPDITQNYGRPLNNTAYFVSVKYITTSGRCKYNLEIA